MPSGKELCGVYEGSEEMNLRQNLNWLLEQYIHELEVIERELRETNESMGRVLLSGEVNIYRKVIEDLTGVLEGEDE